MSTESNNVNGVIEVYNCIVCLENYNNAGRSLAVKTAGCDHTVCHTCTRYYLNETLQKPGYRTSELIQCPSNSCQKTFDSTDDLLKMVFSKEEMDIWWSQAIMKTFIANRIYCPIDDCGAVFDADRDLMNQCTFTECYECHKGFCIACQAPWHPEITESQVVRRDDKKETKETLALAERNRWTRCPGCNYLVQMRDGCNNVRCVCGRNFCYGCGRGSEICVGGCFNLGTHQLNVMRQHMFVYQA